MKKILSYTYTIILIILLSCQLFGQNIRYVNKNVSSSGNGQSWATAWKNFSNINWADMTAGSTLYISGGSDSTVYYETLVPQCRGTFGARIRIMAGRYSPSPSGHSGRVILDGNNGSLSQNIYFDDYSGTAPRYVTIKGLEMRRAVAGVEANIDAARGTSYGCVIDSCYIYDFYDLAGIFIRGCFDSSEVKNTVIKTFINDGVQTDCFHYNGAGNLYPVWNIIHDNIVLNMNQDPMAHNDAVQSVLADGFLIYNNIIINDSVNSPEGGGMPFILSSTDLDYNDTPPVIAFNNFLWMGGTWYPNANAGAVFRSRHDGIGYDAGAQSPNHIFNNTIVCSGPRMAGVDQEWTIKLFINNIVAMYCRNNTYWGSPYGWYSNISGGSGYEARSEIDSFRTNLFWRQDSLQSPTGIFAGSWKKAGTSVSIGSWANWVSNGGTGLFRDPLFVTPFGYSTNHINFKPDLRAGTPAAGQGGSIRYLYNYFKSTYPSVDTIHWEAMKYDIYRTPRSMDSPSIGAYEYSDGEWTPPDTIPSFSFTAVTGANLSTEYIANSTFTGADSTFHVWTTTGSQFQINSGGYSTTMKTANNGDVVYVKNTSSGSYLTATTATIVAGGQSQNFVVTTKASLDTVPNSFTFTDITKATRSTIYTSNAVTLAGFDSAYAYAGGAEYTVYQGLQNPPYTWVTGYTRVHSNDVVRVRLTSSANYSTATNVTLTIGGVSDTFTVTTDAETPSGNGGIMKSKNGRLVKDSTGRIVKVKTQ